MQLGRMENVGLDFMGRYITEPVKTMRKTRLVLGRLDLTRRALSEFGASGKLSSEAVMKMVVPALDVAEDKVRKLAVRVTVDVYKLAGKEQVMPHIQNCKPAVQSRLQRWFDHADGKPSQPTKRAQSSVRLAPISGAKALPPLRMNVAKGASTKPAPPQIPMSHPFGSAQSEEFSMGDEDEQLLDEIMSAS
eukprot:COSAG05_NODE_5820_length_1080_cov_1.308869_1_plen_191_part_00